MKSKVLFLILSFTWGLAGCGSGFSAVDQPATAKSTMPEFERPLVVEEDGYDIVRGGIRVEDIKTQYSEEKKSMSLSGQVILIDTKSAGLKTFNMDLEGQADDQGFIVLKPTGRGTGIPSDIKLAAKATCLGPDHDCYSSFIDIYVAHNDLIYHHQVEAIQEKPQAPTPVVEAPAVPEKPQPSPKPNPVAEEDEHEDDEAIQGGGRYVGDPAKDIEDLLEIKPKEKKPVEGEVKEAKPSIKKVTQAIDTVNNGHLANAISALDYMTHHAPAGFYILRPERKSHFGTNELVYIIGQMGLYTKKEVPGYILPIGDMSKEKGGKFGTHKSHQTGLDADVAFYFESKNLQRSFVSAVTIDKPHGSWMLEKQWGLFKMVNKTKLVDRIFIHKTLKKALCQLAIKNGEIEKSDKSGDVYETLRRLSADTDHNTHFHLRLKCSKAQIRCRQLPEPAAGTGCF
ncbi:penicillin-insensitive murein endopeptidase [Bdellovibrio sp. HCB2-146]|uniref:penicillin-insensitive murein endopeptidase n=1 Tax=Bdellovibrio sp. HCB2-146 TaxID=3394362 RepID=UPI0039BC2822